MSKLTLIAAVALVFPTALLSQAHHNDSFVGTWKLNVAKSKFNPGPAPKSETVTIPAQGKVEVHEVTADGKEVSWSYTSSSSDGTAIPIEGIEGATVSGKMTDENIIDHTWKFPDFTGTGHGVVSKNGKIMTYTMTGNNDQGKPVHNVMTFQKQ
ncbi:MAG TPA: hypothetical protein VK604_27820 [Bryobacteraceae bacterium]|nr:hypothetical protein [Bryobacteraceae bacterium]